MLKSNLIVTISARLVLRWMMAMDRSAGVLWQLNQAYVHRLARAHVYAGLLEAIAIERDGRPAGGAGPALSAARAALASMLEDHRHWRHQFLYTSPVSKRVVQDEAAANRALAQFTRMRTRHDHALNALWLSLGAAPRLDPGLTAVPGGDLWELFAGALVDLLNFDEEARMILPPG